MVPYDRTPWGIRPYGSFPLHDAYKFLLMSMRTMFNSGKMQCFNKAALILKFFNDRESAEEIVKRQSATYYYLPYDDVTSKLTIYDLTRYIRQVYDTSKILVSSRPKGRILGCQGTDVCLRSSQVYDKIGLTGLPMATTIFDFYDIMNNLKAEGREEERRQVKRGFNYQLVISPALKSYNDLLEVFYQKVKELNVYQINGRPLSVILAMQTLKIYRRFISQVIKIYDTYQELGEMHDMIIYAAEIYQDEEVVREVKDSYNSLRSYYDSVWKKILRPIAIDHKYIQSLEDNPVDSIIIDLNIKHNPELRWWWTFLDEIVTIIS